MGQLYEGLQVDQHQLQKERQLLSKLEKVKKDLLPLEEVCSTAIYHNENFYSHQQCYRVHVTLKMRLQKRYPCKKK